TGKPVISSQPRRSMQTEHDRLETLAEAVANAEPDFDGPAWDTLFLPGILGAEARVESTCPATQEAISLVVQPDGIRETSHPQAGVSFLLPSSDFDADVI